MNNSKKNQAGVVGIMVALMMTFFIALLGLAVDSGYMLMERNKLQNVADAVSLACLIKNDDTACGSFGGTATGIATSIGSATNSDLNPSGYSILAKYPCQTSTQCATASASEVFNPFFMRIFNISNLPLKATATAGRPINNCIIATGKISLGGNSPLVGTNCSISASSETLNGSNATITATNNYIYSGSCTGTGSTCSSGTPPVYLPGSVPLPTITPTPTFSTSSPQTDPNCKNATCNLVPGYYKDGIDCHQAKAVCNFGAGSYYLDGPLNLSSNNGSASGAGVFFYMNGTGNKGAISVTAGGNVSLTNLGGTTGSCASNNNQLLFYSPNGYLASQTVDLQGSTGTNLVGNIYLPGYDMALSGGNNLTLNGATVVHNYDSQGGNTSSASISCNLSTKIILTN
jgi:Flp pilus assembly protein TadG